MTLHEAYLKAKYDAEGHGLTLLSSCADYGDFWGFVFVLPTYFQLPPEKRPRGTSITTVNKKTGDIGYFAPYMDWALVAKRKPISIEQFAEYNVAI